MRRVGEVVQLTNGLIIVRITDHRYPPIGTSLLDERLNPVGRVVDVFGPVTNPYLALTSTDNRIDPAILGNRVYLRT